MRSKSIVTKLSYIALIIFYVLIVFTHYAVAATFDFTVEGTISGPLSGVKVYAFSESGSYTGQNATTDSIGQAQFTKEDFADGNYRFRVDFLTEQHWSELIEFPLSDATSFMIEETNVNIGVSDSLDVIQGVNVYLFNSSGSYLGLNAETDAAGQVSFLLPLDLDVKCRADYLGYQFWSDTDTVAPGLLINLLIYSQQIEITVQGIYQGQAEPIEGINTYLFKPPSNYLGISQVTDSAGKVAFNLTEQTYRVRADYRNQQFWSNDFVATDTTIDIPLAEGQITATGIGSALEDVNVYAFSATGTYLGLSKITDINGQVFFRLPAGDYMFRIDYQGSQYWTDTEALQADIVNPIIVSTGGGTFSLAVQKDTGEPLAGINCYVFTEANNYLGITSVTDASGNVNFSLSDGTYKVRIDHMGYQYWTGVFTVPTTLSDTFNLPHNDVLISVNSSFQGSISQLEDVSVYLFTPSETYLGTNTTTDSSGQATINIPENSYKIRADYLGQQYWSIDFNETTVEIVIPFGVAQINVTGAEQNLTDVPVYVFATAGSYLGITDSTDAAGNVQFNLPAGEYKFRADYQGSQYWAEATISADTDTPVVVETGGGAFTLTVDDGSAPLTGVNVYVFNQSGTYLGLSGTTDTSGSVAFSLADGSYRFRADLLGYQFWSADYTLPDTLAGILTIAHQNITITVQRDYPTVESIEGVPTYLFSSAGAYLGQNSITDASGQVTYWLPDKEYKVRGDYRGGQFWTDTFHSQNTTLTIPHGIIEVHVTKSIHNLSDTNVYIFTESGAYLGWSEVTDQTGMVAFLLPEGSYKFRVDVDGEQRWSQIVTPVIGQTNIVNIAIDPLTVSLSAIPETVISGESAALSWTSVGADSCSIEPDIGSVSSNGTLNVTPTNTTTYTITASRGEDNISASATVSIDVQTDTTAPELVSSSPEDGQQVAEIQEITITLLDIQGEVNDVVVITSLLVVDGNEQIVEGSVSENNDVFAFIPYSLPMPSGSYQVIFTAADTSGNSQIYSLGFEIIEFTNESGLISTDTVWTLSDSPYLITGAVTVQGTDGEDEVTTLTIEPGVLVKFNPGTSLNIGAESGDPGALVAQGTDENTIIFTSNQAEPSPGDWDAIAINATSDDATTIIDHCTVEYGGNSMGAISIVDSSPTIQNTLVRNSQNSGVFVTGAEGSSADLNCNTFYQNTIGVSWTVDALVGMHQNNFIENTNYGLYYIGSTLLNAEDNWWNHTSGPNSEGESVYGEPDTEPWSTTINNCVDIQENQPPNTPFSPIPTDGAVGVPAGGGVTLSWSGGDPNTSDLVYYDVYLGPSPNYMPSRATDLEQCTFNAGYLEHGWNYYWQVVARDDKGAETTGPIWHFITEGGLPDLIVDNLTVESFYNLTSGQNITINAEVVNMGSGPIVDPFEVELFVNSISMGTVTINEVILYGGSYQASWTWPYPGGDPTIEILADSQSVVEEDDEDNNNYIVLMSEFADIAPPQLLSITPTEGAYLQQIQQPITVTIEDARSGLDDDAILASLKLIDGNSQQVLGSTAVSGTTFTLMPNTLPLADGEYQVSVTASDEYGNSQTFTSGFIIDAQPPAKPDITGGIVISGPIQARPAQNNANDFIIQFEGSREADTALWINGTRYADLGDSPWAVPMLLDIGDNSVELWLVDRAGNRGESEWVDMNVELDSKVEYFYNSSGRLNRITFE